MVPLWLKKIGSFHFGNFGLDSNDSALQLEGWWVETANQMAEVRVPAMGTPSYIIRTWVSDSATAKSPNTSKAGWFSAAGGRNMSITRCGGEATGRCDCG